ncbi:hypothetical protein KC19_6G213400 [Ceratodon purpureus]|uniref:Uncharacterized protein n=1 Tax=Ceratodon purpureus TaxID=3225 RepID=A0A8T0HK08_CERPU|nr:hypothetical protein KC19_6G213400 [Ceratodon purpureus]
MQLSVTPLKKKELVVGLVATNYTCKRSGLLEGVKQGFPN